MGERKIKYSNILLEMNKTQLKMVINLITGHNTLVKHMVRLRIIEDDTCRWCREAVEDSYHFLCECFALSNRRFNFFGSYLISEVQILGFSLNISRQRNGRRITHYNMKKSIFLRNYNGPP